MKKRDYSLVGQNGNAYALMAYTKKAMEECGCTKEQIGEVMTKAMSGDYNNLVAVLEEELKKLNSEQTAEKLTTIPPAVAALIPMEQLEVTKENLEAFTEAIKQLEEFLGKCPSIGGTEKMKEHPAIFHYFYGGTDIYVCEYDRKDTLFGYTILNGDLDNSEWGYTSLSEITRIRQLNIDYQWEDQSIEAVLYKAYPKHFKKPDSLLA